VAQRTARLGKVQYQILQVLWENGPSTARQITDALAETAVPLAHSTVQTLLRQLEAKGAVTHEVQDRTFLFHAVIAPTDVSTTPTRELLVRVFQGSVYNLMSHLLKSENVSEDELRRLRQLLDRELERDFPTPDKEEQS
jgi:BlaI family transcriptional regulator, penicillinase repressor